MDFRAAVCDDREEDRNALRDLTCRWAEARGHRVRVETFPSAESFLFAWEEEEFDILLLDVEMGELSGIDLAKRVRAGRGRAEIVFITSHFEFMGQGYEVDALHYLVKPVPEGKLFEVLDRAADRLAAEPPALIVSCDGETVKLRQGDILYAEAFAHYLEIHTVTETYRVKESITAFGERLGADFFRAHRSYIVNLKAVERIGRNRLTLTGGAQVPLARGKYDQVNRAFIERN